MTQPKQQRTPREWLGIYLRGLAMGAADVVPGVSGGTIAFVSGIYEELIDSLRRFDASLIRLWRDEGFNAVWHHVNGNFLLTLFTGVLTSIFSLAKLVTYLLDQAPVLVWSFFFGLILAAALHLSRQLSHWPWQRWLQLIGGCVVALLIVTLKPAQLPSSDPVIFAAGMVAISAMLLPGISGGFLLLVMGLYPTIIAAVSDLNIRLLFVLAAGCVVGLVLFSHVLNWLLQRYHDATMATLTGFLFGSLWLIWPWRVVTAVVETSSGARPVAQVPVSPAVYALETGQPAQLGLAFTLALCGFGLVWGLERVAQRAKAS